MYTIVDTPTTVNINTSIINTVKVSVNNTTIISDKPNDNIVLVHDTENVVIVGTSSGPQGMSAYQIAVSNGFIGTEIEWLVSLNGSNSQNNSNYFTYTAGENISGHVAVYMGVDGKVYTANHNTILPIIGVSIQASSINTPINIQYASVIQHSAWNLIPNTPVFVSSTGNIINNIESGSLYSTIIGISNSTNSFIIRIEPQIKLA